MKIKETVESTWTGKTLNFCIKEDEDVSYLMKHDEYRFEHIPLEDGDVILDIGAHVGEVSLLLTTLGKALNIYAYEPVLEQFALMVINISNNPSPSKIHPLWLALGDREKIDKVEWGGSSNMAKHTTLDKIFEDNMIERCKLLVIDCEECEYPMLRATSKETLRKIHYIVGEWHYKSRWELHECVLPLFADRTTELGIAYQWAHNPPVGLFFFENYIKI